MVPVPIAGSLEDLNDHLLEACMGYGGHRAAGQGERVEDLFEREKKYWLPIKGNTETGKQKITAPPPKPGRNINIQGVKIGLPKGVNFRLPFRNIFTMEHNPLKEWSFDHILHSVLLALTGAG